MGPTNVVYQYGQYQMTRRTRDAALLVIWLYRYYKVIIEKFLGTGIVMVMTINLLDTLIEKDMFAQSDILL